MMLWFAWIRSHPRLGWALHVAWLALCVTFVLLAWRVCDFWVGMVWAVAVGLELQAMLVRPTLLASGRLVDESLGLSRRFGAAADHWHSCCTRAHQRQEAITCECFTHLPGEERLASAVLDILRDRGH